MTFTIRHAYKKFPLKSKYKYSKYKEVLLELFYDLNKSIIYDRMELQLPLSGGKIKIAKALVKEKKVLDYKYYKETGKKRFLLNRHSNGYYFFWYWNTKGCRYKNCKLFSILPNRGNDGIIGKRGLKNHIINCSQNPYVKDYDVLTLR